MNGTLERPRRVRARAPRPGHDWRVAEIDGRIAGYAYGSLHRAREACRHSAEVSACVHGRRRGRGLAAALCGELFESLRERGFRALLAGIALPNAPSVALHRSLGFTPVGTFEEVGFELCARHDVSRRQRRA